MEHDQKKEESPSPSGVSEKRPSGKAKYRNGKEAKVGDVVLGFVQTRIGVISGQVVGVSEDQDLVRVALVSVTPAGYSNGLSGRVHTECVGDSTEVSLIGTQVAQADSRLLVLASEAYWAARSAQDDEVCRDLAIARGLDELGRKVTGWSGTPPSLSGSDMDQMEIDQAAKAIQEQQEPQEVRGPSCGCSQRCGLPHDINLSPLAGNQDCRGDLRKVVKLQRSQATRLRSGHHAP